MNQKEYTLSNKDKKFLSAIIFFQASVILLGISVSGWYWNGAMLRAFEIKKTYELGKWAKEEVKKQQSEQKIESIKKNYKSQGIDAEEF